MTLQCCHSSLEEPVPCLKRENPGFGVQKGTQVLRKRFLLSRNGVWIPASAGMTTFYGTIKRWKTEEES
jgi:hypothetical protein